MRICPNVIVPTYFDEDRVQIPGVAPRSPAKHLPADVDTLYEEARRATAGNAPTTAVLAIRKLLMHIAVSQGDAPGKGFVDCVDFLAAKGFVPPGGKGWADHIRKRGNEANHEIRLMTITDAEDLIALC